MNTRQIKALAHALRKAGVRVNVPGNDRPAEGAKNHPEDKNKEATKKVSTSERKRKEHYASTEKNDDPASRQGGVMLHNLWNRMRQVFNWFEGQANPIIALGTVVLGVVGIGSLAFTYEALTDTREQFQAAQRAYITVGRKDGVVAEFIVPQNRPEANAGLVLYFQNSGHLPAKFNWGVTYNAPTNIGSAFPLQFLHSEHVWKPMVRTINRKNRTRSGNAESTIGADSTISEDFGELTQKQVVELATSNKFFPINAAFEYCDEIGTYSCREVIIYYQGLPYNSFHLITENNCSPGLRTVQNVNPGDEYLPPCETAEERRQKHDTGVPSILEPRKK